MRKREPENDIAIIEDDWDNMDDRVERAYDVLRVEKDACLGKRNVIATRMWRGYSARN